MKARWKIATARGASARARVTLPSRVPSSRKMKKGGAQHDFEIAPLLHPPTGLLPHRISEQHARFLPAHRLEAKAEIRAVRGQHARGGVEAIGGEPRH